MAYRLVLFRMAMLILVSTVMATLTRGTDGSGGLPRCRLSLRCTVVLDSNNLSMNRSEVDVLNAIALLCSRLVLRMAKGRRLFVILVFRLCSVRSTGANGWVEVRVLVANWILVRDKVVIGGRNCTIAFVSL